MGQNVSETNIPEWEDWIEKVDPPQGNLYLFRGVLDLRIRIGTARHQCFSVEAMLCLHVPLGSVNSRALRLLFGIPNITNSKNISRILQQICLITTDNRATIKNQGE